MQVAAELGMQFLSKPRESFAYKLHAESESLLKLAQALLSGVDEECTFADLMEGGSLLAALLSDESDREHKSLRQSSKVFVYLMESLGPAADESNFEAPKRVVNFLVDFEKNHLAAATAAATAAARINAENEAQKAAAAAVTDRLTPDLAKAVFTTFEVWDIV